MSHFKPSKNAFSHGLYSDHVVLDCENKQEFADRELHRHGNEAAWWQSIKIEPLPVAYRLWQHSRLNGTAEASVVTTFGIAAGLTFINAEDGGSQ